MRVPYLSLSQDQFGPALPLRTLVPLGEGGLVGRPAALFVVEPQGAQTHALLQVVHPVSSDVNQAGQSAWDDAGVKEERTDVNTCLSRKMEWTSRSISDSNEYLYRLPTCDTQQQKRQHPGLYSTLYLRPSQ